MFDIVETTLAAAVANGGTLTVAYPDGRSKGNYSLADARHVMFVGQQEYHSPEDFTVTFNANASNITVTNGSGVSWPINSACILQLEKRGVNDYRSGDPADPVRMVGAGLYLIDLGSPVVLDADALIKAATGAELPDSTPTSVTYTFPHASASPQDGVNLTGILDVPRNITVAASHGSSVVAMTIKVTGEDVHGREMYEELAITATGTAKTAAGVKAFKKVTSIELYSAADATTNTVNIGYGDVLGLPVFVPHASNILGALIDGVLSTRREAFQLDIGALGTAETAYVPVPFACRVTKALGVSDANGGSATGTITISSGSTALATLPFAAGYTAGTVIEDTSIDTTVIAAGATIKVATDGGGDGAGKTHVTMLVEPVLVTAGSVAKATATTGDVMGTVAMSVASDGDKGFALLAALTDPSDIGQDQYVP